MCPVRRSHRHPRRAGAFQLFAPKLYKFYDWILSSLCKKHPSVSRNFDNSVFASITINLGPRTVTLKHLDHLNIPFGWCVITALGNYDPKHGGHLVLWDLKMIIEFPPGSTILIPSAIISHSNIVVCPHESRYSITQYIAGGLYRWVACGFKLFKAFTAGSRDVQNWRGRRDRRGECALSARACVIPL